MLGCKVIFAKNCTIAIAMFADCQTFSNCQEFEISFLGFFRFSQFRCTREMPCIPKMSRTFHAVRPSEDRNPGILAASPWPLGARRTRAALPNYNLLRFCRTLRSSYESFREKSVAFIKECAAIRAKWGARPNRAKSLKWIPFRGCALSPRQ